MSSKRYSDYMSPEDIAEFEKCSPSEGDLLRMIQAVREQILDVIPHAVKVTPHRCPPHMGFGFELSRRKPGGMEFIGIILVDLGLSCSNTGSVRWVPQTREWDGRKMAKKNLPATFLTLSDPEVFAKIRTLLR